MKKANTKQSPVWKDAFLFVGNDAALDFLNTRPVLNGQPFELLTDFRALLRWFQAAELVTSRQRLTLQRRWPESARARRTLEAVQGFREKLRKEVLGWERGRPIGRLMVRELNQLLAEHPMRARLEGNAAHYSMGIWFEPRQQEDLFAPLAHNAALLFAGVDRTRVRKCAQCVLHFRDTSKKGTRRWCSMRLCGNRQKVAAYAARQRKIFRDR